jgi:transcriptional regulator with PAS, ATPase and Fis domain
MSEHLWVKSFAGAITVCDTEGIILELNDAAIEAFHDDGGEQLLGANVLDCHPEQARAQLEQMMATQQANMYTIEKQGKKKLIYQAPWFRDGKYTGFMEILLDIPDDMPHFIRE